MPKTKKVSTSPTLTQGKADDEKTASVLQDGCYLIRYTPVDLSPDILFYEGTMRVLHVGPDGEPATNGEARAGGDLYCRLRELPYGRDKTNWPSPALYADLATRPDPTTLPNPKGYVPIFPRPDYRYYLEVTSILEGVPAAENFTARFKVHAFERDRAWPNPGSRTISMVKAPPPKPSEWRPPAGLKQPVYFTGNVIDEDSGQIVGALTMGWVAPHLRSATVVIDKIEGVQAPGNKEKWVDKFEQAGWEIQYKERNGKVKGGLIPDAWTIGDLHYALMMAKQSLEKPIELDLANKKMPESVTPKDLDLLDTEWRYQLLCVPRIDGFDRGVMFDTYGSDSENVPREGAAVAAKWDFKEFKEEGGMRTQEEDTNLELRWGLAQGHFLQDEKDVYFRVGVHEIGHAMGLNHNYEDHGFMATTDFIADEQQAKVENAKKEGELAQEKADHFGDVAFVAQTAALLATASSPASIADIALQRAAIAENKATEAKTAACDAVATSEKEIFPKNLTLRFHIEDVNRLRFGPDITVRPGTAFDDYGPNFADEQITRADGLELRVSPLLEAVPLGAPVRIELKLTNTSCNAQKVPGSNSLSLKAGIVSGRVTDPDGNERTFWPLKKCVEDDPHEILEANKSVSHTLTLLRGAQKALFPREGIHRVRVRAAWQCGGARVFVEDETSVRITPAVDGAHRAAALKIISTPDTLLSLAIGGEHLTEGNNAIETAVHNLILKPHFAIVQAKRFLTHKPEEVDPDTKQPRIWGACKLIDDNAVLSLNEIERIQKLLEKEKKTAKAVAEAVKTMIDSLLKKIDRLLLAGADDADRAKVMRERFIAFQNYLS